MKISYEPGASETIVFAASELKAYLEKMVTDMPGDDWKIHLETYTENGNDSFRVAVADCGGTISGNNDRSVLLGVYDYLHTLGCRFVLPQKAYERIPGITAAALPANYARRASCYHRCVCIEGADSFENIRDYIDWLPKVGYNSFFLQFKMPYTFLARWYRHEENPFRDRQPFGEDDVLLAMRLLEDEIRRRGLMLHKVGHGWTGEVLGYETNSWEPWQTPLSPQARPLAAEVGGVRDLYRGIPADTNLCYHSREAVDRFASLVVDYAQKNPEVDYLHVWLADEYNNVCECPDCAQTTLSDQYVELLNEIDRRLTELGLRTRLVFLLYQELLWPPVRQRLANPQRFVLMFAPISRTFERSYSLEGIPDRLPEYARNYVTLPRNLSENLAFLKKWQEQFCGESFIYDYPLGRAHYGDFGYLHIARIISGDIKKLREMGMDGYVSCQELRAALPNALPGYVMGRTLFDADADAEALIDEYFEAAYGEKAGCVREYLEALSELDCCDYLNGIGPRRDDQVAKRMYRARRVCEAFLLRERAEDSGQEPGIFRRLLRYHGQYVMRLADAIGLLASGEQEAAMECWEKLRRYICENEPEFQPFLDVYRVLEVTQKYTGFC